MMSAGRGDELLATPCHTWIMNADLCGAGVIWEKAVLAPAALPIC